MRAWYAWNVDPSPPSPEPDPVVGVGADAGGAGPVEVVADTDGARAARRAIARSCGGRTAVWVGEADEPELEQLRAEIGRRQ